jgi:hypothetical protein
MIAEELIFRWEDGSFFLSGWGIIILLAIIGAIYVWAERK